jgi:hypothetical protein
MRLESEITDQKTNQKPQNVYEFTLENLDGTYVKRSVTIDILQADYVRGVGLTQLAELKQPFKVIHHSFNRGHNLYTGDEEHATPDDMQTLFSVCKNLNTDKDPPHFTSCLFAVKPEFIGHAAEKLRSTGLVNAVPAAADGAARPPAEVRTLVWEKTGKYQKGTGIAHGTEFMVHGFHTSDGSMPYQPFGTGGADSWAECSVLKIPSVTQKYQFNGETLNQGEGNGFLAYTVHPHPPPPPTHTHTHTRPPQHTQPRTRTPTYYRHVVDRRGHYNSW